MDHLIKKSTTTDSIQLVGLQEGDGEMSRSLSSLAVETRVTFRCTEMETAYVGS